MTTRDSIDEFRQTGHWLIDRLADSLEQSLCADGSSVPVLDYRDPETMYQQWSRLVAEGMTHRELFDRVLADSIRLHHPGYLGHQISPPVPVTGLASLMADVINTAGTKYPATMSALRAILARLRCAPATIRTICES